MAKPSIVDAFYESCFAIGPAFLRAAEGGATDKELYEEHEEFWALTSQGLTLTLWCHLVETYFGGRDQYRARLNDERDRELVRILFYARNAFVHCAWDISMLDPRYEQEEKIREFVGDGYTHPFITAFKMRIDPGNFLRIECLQNICHILNKEAEVVEA